MKKENLFYTVDAGTSSCATGFFTSVDNINDVIQKCPQILPCGICRLTNQQCPKYWGTGSWDRVWTSTHSE